ncbi:LysM peptidoglycan-binding domain-containing protein [Macrococcus carouselicus]|uniref:LysM peptidoglycan-binding domain-containing protein n=1 Tax=Macrococcus carouselicus TaxID=69969 RepID=A0A9Q8CLE6_9STAP|nr:LysM peptidoglycan-binding domain-containing protein [Macrococcus carouselicus]TDM04286.1 LysM peptidoglycan-binding domain-containing protein [Macrococcus carouselicus]
MSKDNFKDEFEKSKQPVERQDDQTNDDLVFEGENFTESKEPGDFPPRGMSRRNRSAERRRREETPEEETVEKMVYSSKKKRRRKGGAAVGAAAATQGDIDTPAEAEEVKTATFAAGDGEPEIHHVDSEEHENKEKSNKWLPLLAGLLILIPLLFLLFMYFSNKDDNHKEKAVTTEETTEKVTTEKPAKEKATTEAPVATAEETTEETTTEEIATEEPTTEETTTEEIATEEPTTEEATTEKATTEEPTTEEATTEKPSANQSEQTHTVGANENLYRIAIRYYGSGTPENVEKIRQANGLTGNTLSIGQELVIPE